MQEHEDDDDDQHQRFDQGLLDFLDPFSDGLGGVEGDDVIEIRRETFLQLGHQFFGAGGRFEGVGAWHLVQRQHCRRFAVQAAFHAVGLGAEFDARDVAYPHHRAVWIGAYDDGTEFLRRLQPALGADGVSEFLPARYRLGADRAGRIDGVLRVDRVDDLGNRDVEFGQLVRIDPQAHGVLAGTEDGDAGDALDPGELIVEVDVGVVGEKDVVIGVVRRVNAEQEERRGG